MRCSTPLRMVLALLPIATWMGCDSGPVANRSGNSTALAPAQPESAAEIALILPAQETPLLRLWERMARQEAGQSQVFISVERPASGGGASQQAGLIQAAVDRMVAALVVVPEDAEVVVPALESARASGIPVILLDRTLSSGAGEPFPRVAVASSEELATKMVETMLEDAAKAGLPSSTPAVIFYSTTISPELIASRSTAVRDALEARQVPIAPDAVYSTPGKSQQAMQASVEQADNPTSLIFALDDQSLSSAIQYRATLEEEPQKTLLIAGFADERTTLDSVRYGLLNIGVDVNLSETAREAVRLAIRGSRGETIPELVTTPATFRLAEGPPRGNEFPSPRRDLREATVPDGAPTD